MTINNEKYETSVDLIKDPRIHVSDDDINVQFNFAMEIRNQTDLANRSVIEIRNMKVHLDSIISKKSSNRSAKIKMLISKLEIIESSIYQVKNQSGQDPLNFPIRVNNRLAYLRKSVESGDGLPTKGSREVFKLLKDELLGYTNSLDKLKKEFNRYL